MFKMSFYDGTHDREKAKEFVETTEKPLYYRYGFAYRGAEARPISLDSALFVIKEECYLDIDEYEDKVILNTYSSNDMW